MTQPFERLPARVGPFEITGLLGEGGMGVVYSARTSRGDRVAVKTVPSVDATLRSTLRREIHALSRLKHPGVVRVLASGVDAGRPWYAMELLEGATLGALRDSLWGDLIGLLKTHVSAGGTDAIATVPITKRVEPPTGAPAPLPVSVGRKLVAGGSLPRVLAMTRRLLGTLAFIHGEGIVHRDLKPQNVFLRQGDQPVLVDFGLAWRSAGTVGREVVDDAVDVVGTPAYMAPEQIRADLVDSRADLYALGCLLYELLTGRPPFVGPSAVVMEHHIGIDPAPPSEIVEGCPRALDALVLELLAKRPRERVGHAIDAIYQLEAMGVFAEPMPTQQPRAYVHRPTLAGRDVALDVLERATSAALHGKGACVLIAGESGMGKTYLAMEAARRAASFQLVTGTCASRQPLAPLGKLFDTIVDRCTAGGRRETDRLLGPNGKILAAHAPELARLTGQDAYPEPTMLFGPAGRDRLLLALSETLAALALAQPVLLLLDDLQWADEVTMRFLTSLTDDWFADKRVLVVGTYRIEEATPSIAELGARPYAREVALGKLDEQVVRSLICDMLAVDAPPPPFVQFLARHSEGNPFFVAEYLRTATAEGLIRRGAGRRLRFGEEGVDSANIEMLQLPLTMPELVGRRLDGLSAPARRLAACASVMGREFDPEVASDATGSSENDALEAIAELIARQVIEATEEGALRFVHDKLYEIAYERQDDAARRGFHHAVGAAIEARYPEPARARHYAALAHHYLTAGVDELALEYLEKAGERALSAATYGEACDLYRKLIALDDRRNVKVAPRRRARWERRLGEGCFNLGDLQGCEDASLAAMERLGRAMPDASRGWLAAMARLTKMTGKQALHRAGVGVGTVTGEAERDDMREVAIAAATMAWRYFFIDDMVGVVSMSLLSVNEIEAASPPIRLASPYAWLGYTAGFARLHPAARFYFAEARAAAAETSDTAGRHFASLMEALYHVGFARWADAERLSRAALDQLRDAGDPTNAEHHLTSLANAEFYVGRFAESIRHFEQIMRAARSRRNWQHVAWGLYASCKGMIAQGRFDEALPRLDEARALLDTLSDAASQIITSGLYAQLHLRRGDDDAARAMADDATRRIRKSRAVVYSTVVGYLGTAETYLELYARRPDPELLGLARRACADLRKFALLFPFAGPAAARYTAQLLALEGKRLRARRGFERAISLSRELAMPYDEAQALWLQGRHLDDRARLGTAKTIFDRLGCAWHSQQAR